MSSRPNSVSGEIWIEVAHNRSFDYALRDTLGMTVILYIELEKGMKTCWR